MNGRKLLMTTASISLFIIAILVVFAFNVGNNDIIINFESEVVCKTIAKDLKKECVNNSFKISKEEIENYSNLTVVGDIESLKGIEKFTNLKNVTILNEVKLIDITPIQNLNKLENLTITTNNGNNNLLNNISVLSNLSELKNLDISNSYVVDVSMLSNLSNLESLDITNTNIYDVSSINNGKIKIQKRNLYFDTNIQQTLDGVLVSLGQPSNYFLVDGPCSIDDKYNLIYNDIDNPDNILNQCYIKTPDDFITLEYNLIIEN